MKLYWARWAGRLVAGVPATLPQKLLRGVSAVFVSGSDMDAFFDPEPDAPGKTYERPGSAGERRCDWGKISI